MSNAQTKYEIAIKPTGRFSALHLRELWEYRELFYFLIWRDVKVKYKQTILGVAWAVVRPVASMAVFTFVFNRLAGFSADGIPYPLFTFAGILAWSFFSEGLTGSSQSLVSNANLISKVYFPRLIIPAAAVLRGLIDFGIALLVFIGLMVYYHFSPGYKMALFPITLVWGIVASLGVGLWFTAIGVKYRDVAQALPFVVQFLFWITPVGYSSARVPSHFEFLYWLNPMTGVIEGFRHSLLGHGHLPLNLLVLSIFITIVIFVTGVMNFRRMEREFADVI